MKFYISILCILISGKVLSIQKHPSPIPIDWYDCSGKAPGRYMHTIDCTKYIFCDEDENALEVRCPNCTNIQAHLCPHGRLLFNDEEKICFPASLTKCKVADEAPPPVTSTTAVPTEPPVPPTTTMTTVSTPTSPPIIPTSTNPTTIAPPEDPPQPGDECDHEECKTVGYRCQSYLRCERGGKWFEEDCGESLFWNPLNPNGTKQIHGGNCDFMKNLRPETLQKYKDDPECCLE